MMDFATVNFVCTYAVITVQVAQPDIDDDQWISDTAAEIFLSEYGIDPRTICYDIEVDYL